MKSKAQRRALREGHEPIHGVGGVVYRFGENGRIDVLLIRKRDGYWTLPKGQLKPGESEAEALVREVGEETGIAGEVGALVRRVTYVTPNRRPARRKEVTYYLFRADGGEPHPHLPEGIVEARWVSLRGTLQRVHRKRVRRVVRAAADMLRSGEPERLAAPEPAEGPGSEQSKAA